MRHDSRDPTDVRYIPDDWLNPIPVETLFEKRQDLEVDVGCGKGRFLLARASKHPDINFLGIDRMLRRIRKVNRKVVRRGLRNVRIMRSALALNGSYFNTQRMLQEYLYKAYLP